MNSCNCGKPGGPDCQLAKSLTINVPVQQGKSTTPTPDAIQWQGSPPEFADSVAETYAEAEGVLIRKHRDYGPKNISLSPGGPLNGLRVRMHDKLARINNLLDTGAEPANESLRDSFLDLMNYSAIALLVLDGKWPE